MIAPEAIPGAARQPWRAASCILALATAALIAGLVASGGEALFSVAADVALGVAGYLSTRVLLAPPNGVSEWGRAVARLLLAVAPALVLVLLAVLLASAALLPPADLRNQAWTAMWTAGGASGGELLKLGAWSPEISGELLLHGWIVGVAAQLALGWSLVVLVLRRVGREHWLGLVALAGAVVSLLLYIQLLRQGFDIQAFYLSPSRAWGFLIGAAAATVRWPEPSVPPALNRALGGLAEAGRLALPVYLWIWPLLVAPRMILARPPTSLEVVAALAAAVLLAVATRRWVERPLWARLAERPLAGAGACLGGLALVAALAAGIFAFEGLPGRASPAVRAEEAVARRLPPLQAACHVEGEALPNAAACTVPSAARPDVILWGNSHASHLSPALLEWAEQRGLSVRQATRSGCLPLIRAGTGLANDGCVRFNLAAIEEWGRTKPRLIVVGAGWTVVLNRASGDEEAGLDVLASELVHTLQVLRAAVGPSTRIVLLADTPDYGLPPAACHARRAFLGLDTTRCDLAHPANVGLASRVEARLARIATDEPGVTVFSPRTALCEGDLCRTRSATGPWYSDRSHMTEAGGRAQGPALAVVLDAAMPRL